MILTKYKLGDILDVTRGASLSGEFYATEGEYIRLTCGNFDYQNNCFKENKSKDNLYYVGDFKPEFLGRYVFTSSRERELVYSHYTIYNGLITPSEETQGGKFWNVQEIERMLGSETFTPNFENEFIQLLKSSGLVQKIQAKIGRIQQNE